jgi:hypothetical protein
LVRSAHIIDLSRDKSPSIRVYGLHQSHDESQRLGF